MNRNELLKKITQKKEFSQLPKKDIEMAFAEFDKEQYGDEEKVKLTRDLLRKVFSAFASQKILSLKDKDEGWVLRKHLSTRERLPYYKELYEKLLKGFEGGVTIFDLGAGVNGFSYEYMIESEVRSEPVPSRPSATSSPTKDSLVKPRREINYIGIEAMKQLVDLMNHHFKTRGLENCTALHLSLFELEKIKQVISKQRGNKVVFLFKTLDSLEMLKRDYSKKLLLEIVPLVDRVVVSFATRSLVRKTKFKVKRKWIIDFIKENFEVLDDFELGGERYVVFSSKK